MIFFPSYKLMEDVFEVYQEEFSADWVDCICQQASMNEREREEFLREFQAQGEKTLLGFCVMGGIFSEGIDPSLTDLDQDITSPGNDPCVRMFRKKLHCF